MILHQVTELKAHEVTGIMELTPVWFEEAALAETAFQPESYITELSRYVPLETICAQLESYLAQLKSQVRL